MTPDIVIVGGGPVGLAAAIAARQRGFEVLVADREMPPIDKPCGEGLMPEGVSVLGALGIQPNGHAVPFRGLRFTEAGLSAEAGFGAEHGLGIRRTVLHRLLVDGAAEAGVATRWGEAVTRVSRDGVELGGRKVACRWVVGADGRGSRVRHWAGLEPGSSERRRIGMRQHFRVTPWTDFVEVHWNDHGQAVVTPVAADEICISILATNVRYRMSELIEFFPELRRRLDGAAPSSQASGALCGSSTMRAVVGGRVALIGDAAGTVDAITGEGLSIGFRAALALADALARDKLDQYAAAHRRISRMPRLMARLMLFVAARSGLRRRVLRGLNSQSRIFGFMLGVHTGTASARALPVGAVAGFARQMLACESFEDGDVA
jgi:flavin-dependent dehydrogenase